MSKPHEEQPQLEVYEGGEGPPLVLLHGLGGSWHIWKPVIERLKTRFHIIAPTLPGHPGGEPLKQPDAVTVSTLLEQLTEQLHARGIKSAHVAGNSLGGWLTLELARSGFARTATGLSPAGAWGTQKDFKRLMRTLLIPYMLMPVFRCIAWLFGGLAKVRQALGATTMEHGERLSRTDLLDILRRFSHTRMMRKLFANAGRDGPIKDFDAGDIPVCIAWGSEDKIIPFDNYGTPLQARVTGAQWIRVEGVGHVPMYDDPDRIAEIIAANCARAEAANTTLGVSAA
ncbi:MAG: alpha/beta hydrolase [Sinobacteraceae bacterium]|nr:alpha/beta hydrolase [Nevskiaceae bacterium]